MVALSDGGGGVNNSAEFSTGVESSVTATMLVLFSLVGPALASPLGSIFNVVRLDDIRTFSTKVAELITVKTLFLSFVRTISSKVIG